MSKLKTLYALTAAWLAVFVWALVGSVLWWQVSFAFVVIYAVLFAVTAAHCGVLVVYYMDYHEGKDWE
jgi:hypothetical protein